MDRFKWGAIGAALALALLAYFAFRRDLPTRAYELKIVERAQWKNLQMARHEHDLELAGEAPMPRADARRIVQRERALTDSVYVTGQKRQKVLENQLRQGWLVAYGEGDLTIDPARPLSKGTLSARLGVAVRIKGQWKVYGEKQLGAAGWHVGVRQEVRIF